MEGLSEIKLIRTDTTLDLSQKAESNYGRNFLGTIYVFGKPQFAFRVGFGDVLSSNEAWPAVYDILCCMCGLLGRAVRDITVATAFT